MKRRPFLASAYLCSIVVVFGAAVSLSAAEAWPDRWQVNGNGETGALQLTVDDRGVLTGQLFDHPVEGFVSGRHIVMRRSVDGRTEVWEGWLSGDGTGSNPIIAGTISLAEGGESQVYPWYGTLEAQGVAETPESADTPAAAPVVVAPAAPQTSAAPVTENSATAATPPASPGGPLAGSWVSLTGERMEIGQDGKRLTVIMPDGSSHSGRVTGDASLVVGLRKGCCNGRLESPDVIVWNDGARWERSD